MATKDKEDSPYAKEAGEAGKPVGPEHDASFSAPDYFDPETGERVGTPWDTEAQKNHPGIGKPGVTEKVSGGESGEVTKPSASAKDSTK